MTRVITTLAESFGVEPVCRELGVHASTHYARLERLREPSATQRRHEALLGHVKEVRTGYRWCYGQKRTWEEITEEGVDVGRDQVAAVMRTNGLCGVMRGPEPVTTTPEQADFVWRAPDLVRRDFTATGPNELWVADFTYLRAHAGFLYLAFILDVYSRYLVGWQLAWHRRASLVTDALEMAVAVRQPERGMKCHTDAGSQYTSVAYTDHLYRAGVRPSIGTVGCALDNAMAESWVATYKHELVRGRVFPGMEHAEHETLQWISFYNHERRHTRLGGLSPAKFEQQTRPSEPSRPCGPLPAVQPAFPGALTDRQQLLLETT